jgi:hypothetical protein
MVKAIFFSGLCTAVLLLAGCVKNDPAPVQRGNASVDVVNASDNILNFYVNGTRQSVLTGIFPLSNNGYTTVPYGNQVLTFKQLFDKENFNNADTLFSLPVQLDSVSSTTRYSIFLGGITRNAAFMVKDDLTANSRNAKVRFVVASPSVTSFKVYFNDTLRYTATAFKAVSDFDTVGTGLKKIEIRQANTNKVLSTSTVRLNASRSYTLFSQGSTESNIRLGLVTNQ